RHLLGTASLAMRAALLPNDEQRLRQEQMTACGSAKASETELSQHWIALGQVACRCHPALIAGVEIDGGDTPVWWFPEGHALHPLNRRHLHVVIATFHVLLCERALVETRDRGDIAYSRLWLYHH